MAIIEGEKNVSWVIKSWFEFKSCSRAPIMLLLWISHAQHDLKWWMFCSISAILVVAIGGSVFSRKRGSWTNWRSDDISSRSTTQSWTLLHCKIDLGLYLSNGKAGGQNWCSWRSRIRPVTFLWCCSSTARKSEEWNWSPRKKKWKWNVNVYFEKEIDWWGEA